MTPDSPVLTVLGQGKLVQISIDLVSRLHRTIDYSTATFPVFFPYDNFSFPLNF